MLCPNARLVGAGLAPPSFLSKVYRTHHCHSDWYRIESHATRDTDLGISEGPTKTILAAVALAPADIKMTQWNENEGASQHVLRLLEESGALLEPRVCERCQEFARSFHNKHGMRVHSDSISYASDTYQGPLRQIDQCVSLYKEFVIDERTGITLHVQIPIEVKNRRDVEAFGIEYLSHSYRPLMPITASIQGSRLSLAITNTSPFQNLPLLAPVFLGHHEYVTFSESTPSSPGVP